MYLFFYHWTKSFIRNAYVTQTHNIRYERDSVERYNEYWLLLINYYFPVWVVCVELLSSFARWSAQSIFSCAHLNGLFTPHQFLCIGNECTELKALISSADCGPACASTGPSLGQQWPQLPSTGPAVRGSDDSIHPNFDTIRFNIDISNRIESSKIIEFFDISRCLKNIAIFLKYHDIS